MSEQEIKDFSELFSTHYGKYNGKDGKRKKGEQIKLGQRYYRNYMSNPNMFVSFCRKSEQGELIGQAFFLKIAIPGVGACSWVTQLLVHSTYRGRGIASRLLQSAWGFSNYYAWGLATANSVTIKTLESVTWREVTPIEIQENLSLIEKMCKEIPFAHFDKRSLSEDQSQLFTDFYPEAEKPIPVYVERLGELKEGYEWLAFTFQNQSMLYDEKKFNSMLDFSMNQLQEAYSRMDMSVQPWTKGTVNEVNLITEKLEMPSDSYILDMGCGQGRHAIELAKRGNRVLAIDFSEKLLEQAKANSENLSITYQLEDCRKFKTKIKFDYLICLYDVIGSFREDINNQKIIKKIKAALNKGGKAVISVMNMELTEFLAINKGEVKKNPELLMSLKASNIMATRGNIFDPDYFVLDTTDRLIYRKEQFERDGALSAEYMLADRRYTGAEISALFKSEGFKILHLSYVQAGKWDQALEPTDKRAKEIMLIIERT